MSYKNSMSKTNIDKKLAKLMQKCCDNEEKYGHYLRRIKSRILDLES